MLTAPRVLAVGACPLVRFPLTAAIRRGGYQPLEAETGAEAVERCAAERPAGVLLGLAHGDAAELAPLRALQAADAATRVGVVTPHATDALVRAALAAGACELVAQPATEHRLTQAVQRVAAPPTRRTSERIAAMLPALLTLPAWRAEAAPCLVEDLSLSGARCCVREPAPAAVLAPGTVGELTVVLPGGTRIAATVRLVRTIAEGTVGVTFLHLGARDGRALDAYYARARAEHDLPAAA